MGNTEDALESVGVYTKQQRIAELGRLINNISKGDGRSRPIGIPTLEDKVLQRAVVMVLTPLYEQDFLECSYGFRPRRSVHQALEVMWRKVMEMGGCWVLEVDIKSFFRHSEV